LSLWLCEPKRGGRTATEPAGTGKPAGPTEEDPRRRDLDGQALADWLAERYPEIKIVIASGVRQESPDDVPFLLKPYAFSDLGTLIERLLKS
jgi:hypothetical protein